MLDIRLFGSVELKLNGRPLDKFISHKADALLIYLACHERPFSREQLATLFWGDSPETKALANLSVILTSLRKQLAPYILADRQTIAFNHSADTFLDYAAFKQSIANARHQQHNQTTRSTAAQLARAVNHYRGPFMSGFKVRLAPDFEEWVLIEQESVTQLAIEALDTLIDFHLAREQYARGIEYGQQMVVIDPLYENAHRQLMRLYALDGQRNTALAQYETCRTILDAELGVPPDEETQQLFEQIKGKTYAPNLTKPPTITPDLQLSKHNLPASQTLFVGRETELSQIRKLIDNPACRLLTLVGPGGVGKSRLAREAAHYAIDTFWHGVWFVSLVGLKSEKYLAETIAEALNLELGTDTAVSQLTNYLRQKELLLILDNFEHILDGADLLVTLLKAAPELKIMVTSRERLNIRAEWLVDIGGLPYPTTSKQLEGADILAFDAVDLFLQRARQIQFIATITPQQSTAIGRICQLVQGLPLALELAAAWTRTLSFNDIAVEIEHNLALLATNLRDIEPRHRSIEAVFAYSWQLLPTGEQKVLRQLAVFQAEFSAVAAQAVSGATLVTLLGLVDKSLLIQQDKADQLFTLHMLIRQFLQTKLNHDPTELVQTKQRHATYYAGFIQDHTRLMKGHGMASAQADIRAEFENVRQAWRYTLQTYAATLMEQMHEGFMIYTELRGLYQFGVQAYADAVTACEAVFDATDKDSCRLLGKMLVGFGWHHFRLGQHQQAKDAAERSLSLFEKHAICEARDYPLLIIGAVAYVTGDLVTAAKMCEESAAIFWDNDDAWGYAGLMSNLAQVHKLAGANEQARETAELGLQAATQAGSLFQMGSCQNVLGSLAYTAGDMVLAKTYLENALNNVRKIDLQVEIANILVELAKVMSRLGKTQQSEAYINEGINIYTEIGSRWGQAQAWQTAGMLAIRRKYWSQAKQYLAQSLRLTREIGAEPICLQALYGFTFVLAEMNQPENALATLTFCQQHSSNQLSAFGEDEQLKTALLAKLTPSAAKTAQSYANQIQLNDLIQQIFVWLP